MKGDVTYRNYLLDLLSEEESVALEKQYFSDDVSFEELLEAEDDLIDSFVRGELPPHERTAFEKRVLFLPRLRQRVDAARGIEALAEGSPLAARHAGRAGIPSRFLAVATALFLVVMGVVAGAAWWRQRVSLDAMIQRQAQLEQELRLAREQLERDRAVLQALTTSSSPSIPSESPTAESTIASETAPVILVLTALTRGSGSNDFNRPPTAERIILRAPVGGASQASYRVSIQKVSGGKVWTSSDVPAAGKGKSRSIDIHVPASTLPPGDYFLIIANSASPSQVVQEFSFRIHE